VRIPTWLDGNRHWWAPYLSVVGLALAAALLLSLCILANGAEVLRTLRSAGG
jgi:hypothetical protein